MFCFPNQHGAKDAAPVEIDDLELFFEAWDLWDKNFNAKLPVTEYPSPSLNRHRTEWKSRRYGLRESGKKYILESSGKPLYDADEEYIGGVLWTRNLGEYHDVIAHDLEVTLADFRTICDRLPHMLLTVDPNGKADYISQSWYEFTGLSVAQSLGYELQKAIHPDDMAQIWAGFHRVSDASGEVQCEARYKKHNGDWVWMVVRAKPGIGANGQGLKWYGSSTEIHDLVKERAEAERTKIPSHRNARACRGCTVSFVRGLLGCLIDITEHRQRAALEAENARLAADKTLEMEKNNLKSVFLAHMSYEIGTPIAGVIGSAEMLTETHIGDEERSLLDSIQVSANNLLVIVNDILDISKIEWGKMQLEKIPINLAQVLKQIGRIAQILSNMISNAIKFAPEGYVELQIKHDDSEIRFCVRDTGIGIDDNAKKKLFTPFSQGDSSKARRHGGTGLGLTISRNLGELMGGSLNVDSEFSQGTTATSTIPSTSRLTLNSVSSAGRSEIDISAALTNGILTQREATTTSVTTPTQPLTKPLTPPMRAEKIILIAEDNPINQKVALHSVRKLGYTAEAVWSGQEALDYVTSQRNVGLILMDCQMPPLDGYAATRMLRQSHRYAEFSRLPIVALTASAIKGDREACHEAGMDGYLTKPIQKQLLRDMLMPWFPA